MIELPEQADVLDALALIAQDNGVTDFQVSGLIDLVSSLTTEQAQQVIDGTLILNSDLNLETTAGVVAVTNPRNKIDELGIPEGIVFVTEERITIIEAQLRAQIEKVQERNQQADVLNQLSSKLTELSKKFPADAAPSDGIPDGNEALIEEINNLASSASITLSLSNFGEVESAIAKVENETNTLTNQQQLETFKLQSLNTKFNQAFELMSAVVKKLSDTLSTIVGNMR